MGFDIHFVTRFKLEDIKEKTDITVIPLENKNEFGLKKDNSSLGVKIDDDGYAYYGFCNISYDPTLILQELNEKLDTKFLSDNTEEGYDFYMSEKPNGETLNKAVNATLNFFGIEDKIDQE